ncbi:hypothetical protein [Halopelagius longus]|uniref:Hsp20/alpha crystallin family protein n=1 Tax=Halopelagius longus TaxID=1236180 RepID=A0A1H0Y6D3_9EURY|nr:hypothetical protein [Halopelagius longus]RDI72304.1 hypothetical protein DWB78_11605 [Halopelagius longus]SDQ10728.1 hypothetical protein SAMN05216278_0433 [Halopelagius longus]
MEAPRQLRSAANEREDITIAHRDYEGESVVAIDFGPGVEATVDIVGETAIVVAGENQFEFDVPPEATEITTNDGILLIKE